MAAENELAAEKARADHLQSVLNAALEEARKANDAMRGMKSTIEREVEARHRSDRLALEKSIGRYQSLLKEASVQAREAAEGLDQLKMMSNAATFKSSSGTLHAQVAQLQKELTAADVKSDVALSTEQSRVRELEKLVQRQQLQHAAELAEERHKYEVLLASYAKLKQETAVPSMSPESEHAVTGAVPSMSPESEHAIIRSLSRQDQNTDHCTKISILDQNDLSQYLTELFFVAAGRSKRLDGHRLAQLLSQCKLGLSNRMINSIVQRQGPWIDLAQYQSIVQQLVQQSPLSTPQGRSPSSSPEQQHVVHNPLCSVTPSAPHPRSNSDDWEDAKYIAQGLLERADQTDHDAFVADLNQQYDSIDRHRSPRAAARTSQSHNPKTSSQRRVPKSSRTHTAQHCVVNHPSKMPYSQRGMYGVRQNRRSVSPSETSESKPKKSNSGQRPQSVSGFQRSRSQNKSAAPWVPPSTKKMSASLDTFCTRGYYDRFSGL